MRRQLYTFVMLICVCSITCLILSFGDGNNPPEAENRIEWRSDVRLVWNDFEGIPNGFSTYKAITNTRMKLEPIRVTRDSLVYVVTTYFNKDLSWSREKTSVDLLRHEQLHFDIAEWVNRMIRSKCVKLNLSDIEPDYKALNRIFDHYSAAVLDSINLLYDHDTKHGADLLNQLRWERKVNDGLEALNRYADTRVVIVRR